MVGVWWHHKDDTRLDDLEEAVSKLKRDFSSLQVEWEMTHNQIIKRLRAIAKEARTVEQSEETINPVGGPELSANEQLILSRLPPAQRAIQAQIYLNRKRPNGGQQ